ncbi:MAG TPA: flagellar hook-basal body complex protein FliE [Chthonomonas sp.]|jgi:flagellar hook-basal body complex protein FliE|uniref:flagellar hook-basal body complex protein FliE n=1 Tax=Chthonomonas sp. TaxID=2282153 RepID=UPI002B4B3C1E|nr:flagellar hook-basal body complex protein FliE [Chthonomonas sp.]HLH80797.1 flagellar hook-basal body complex protein FliE [Chthonomonas sp.]
MRMDAPTPLFDIAPAVQQSVSPFSAPTGPGETSVSGKSFGQFLSEAINEVNQAQLHADDLTARFAAGEPLDVHQVMIASQEASVALDLAVQVRNRLLDAYQQIISLNV